jgi:hypothetical protein
MMVNQNKRAQPISVKDLSPRGRSAVKTKRIIGRESLKDWTRLIQELARFDAATDNAYERARGYLVLFVVLAVVFGVAAGMIDKNRSSFGAHHLAQTLTFICMGLVVLCVLWGIVSLVRMLLLKRVDLVNDFRLFLPEFFDELGEDMDPKTKVRLYLDMKGPSKDKIVKTRKLPAPRWTTLIQTVYRDRWLRLAMEFADGNVVRLEVWNLYTLLDRRRWQTSSRGKIKRKRKLKWRKVVITRVSIALAGADRQWDQDRLKEYARANKLKLRERKGKKFCGLARKDKFKSVGKPPPETAAVEEVIGMLMKLYGLTGPAPKAAASSSRHGEGSTG